MPNERRAGSWKCRGKRLEGEERTKKCAYTEWNIRMCTKPIIIIEHRGKKKTWRAEEGLNNMATRTVEEAIRAMCNIEPRI